MTRHPATVGGRERDAVLRVEWEEGSAGVDDWGVCSFGDDEAAGSESVSIVQVYERFGGKGRGGKNSAERCSVGPSCERAHSSEEERRSQVFDSGPAALDCVVDHRRRSGRHSPSTFSVFQIEYRMHCSRGTLKSNPRLKGLDDGFGYLKPGVLSIGTTNESNKRKILTIRALESPDLRIATHV